MHRVALVPVATLDSNWGRGSPPRCPYYVELRTAGSVGAHFLPTESAAARGPSTIPREHQGMFVR